MEGDLRPLYDALDAGDEETVACIERILAVK
jgi:hypothetical protein